MTLDTAATLGDELSDVQARTFTRWVNIKLESRDVPPLRDLVQDLRDGVRLLQLLEIMSETSLGRFNQAPKMRVQKAENATKALDFIRSRGIRLTNIGSEDIVDGNVKLVLGLIWTLILRFAIASINEEGLQAKDGLLLWCQRKTQPYHPYVRVTSFKTGWSDGLALCALIHRHRPELIDWDKLDKDDARSNTALAFDIAAQHLSIPALLEVEDLCDRVPDERSVMTYVAEYFHAFSSMDRAETVARRIEKFTEVMTIVDSSRTDYEMRIEALILGIEAKQREWKTAATAQSYPEAKAQLAAFADFKRTTKRSWIKERQDLTTAFGNLQTKLKTSGLQAYRAPRGLTLQDLEECWSNISEAEARRSIAINTNIRDIKDAMRQRFADAANQLSHRIASVEAKIGLAEGSLDDQRRAIQQLSGSLPMMRKTLRDVNTLNQECLQAGIEENDFTVVSYEDLEYEIGLLESNLRKKLSFIENQIVSAGQSNVTPAQLEEWQATWRYFDTDGLNVLDGLQLQSALASLGLVYSEDDIFDIQTALERKHGAVTYEAFVELLNGITEDSSSHDQLLEAFKAVALDKEHIDTQDLQQAQLSASARNYLAKQLPAVPESESAQPAFDYQAFLRQTFAPE